MAKGDAVASLATAVASIRRLRPAPDALLLTGDLADNLADSEYALLRVSLEGSLVVAYSALRAHTSDSSSTSRPSRSTMTPPRRAT